MVVGWVVAASEELEQNKAANAFLGHISKKPNNPLKAAASSAGAVLSKTGALGKRRMSYHPMGAALQTRLVNTMTNEGKKVVFTGVPPVIAVQLAACQQFKWSACRVEDLEARVPVTTDDELDIAVAEWEERQDARRIDNIEATLEGIRSNLATGVLDKQVDGCVALSRFICQEK